MPEKFRPWAKALRALCLKKLKDFGGKGTARQICDAVGKDAGIVTPRLTELAELGAIRDTGERINIGRGRPQTVWAVVDLCDESDCDNPRSGHTQGGHDDGAPSWFRRFGT